ncbi:carbohydrate-binding family 9-like protein [Saliphagus infecundisoli]|uniref:Carbohydrate-binding family 9-like protein n=1 Tax=Saliphagus infecundisoli TaxID=1849069 RepID=A0ABD5QE13_9EURY|nr:carbohydrate-binding family 9-like protein [Saliphagus infecundisoli]
MKTYTIRRADGDVPLGETVAGTPWVKADTVYIDEFSWHDEGPKPATQGHVLYDDRALFLQFFAEDDEIHAETTELNGPTYADSSVEFFAAPGGDRYFNFEANCCGQFKLAWQEPGWQVHGQRELISPELASRIDVRTSVPGSTKEPAPGDDGWWLAAAIPFSVLSELTGREIGPETGTEWRGNVYRSGVPDPRKATWNPIEEPEPAYHSPEYFGRLRFE